MNQIGMPVQVTPQEVSRETSLGGAMELCAKAAGFEGKQIQDALRLDKAQWSRWKSGAEGVVWPKFRAVMDYCGNDAPLMWMNMNCGYDIASMRKLETETERELRAERELRLAAEEKVRYFEEVMTGRRSRA